jgi:hypothetical protein
MVMQPATQNLPLLDTPSALFIEFFLSGRDYGTIAEFIWCHIFEECPSGTTV